MFSFSLYNLKESDGGYYYCLANNEYGTDRCWVYLDIRPRPKIDMSATGNQVIEENLVEPEVMPKIEEEKVEITPTKEVENLPEIEQMPDNGWPDVKINGSEPRMMKDVLEIDLIEGWQLIN